jgi:hypothetical protein
MPGIVKTELATGLPEPRFVKHTEPRAVAAAIVDVLGAPRFDVFVPREIGALMRLAGVLPRSAREALSRALKADRVLDLPDGRVRRDYEQRAARSGEGLPAGEEPVRLPTSPT